MDYIQFNSGACSRNIPWWYFILKKFIPASNPDIEKFYFDVEYWWIELDDEGIPKREIGFDRNKKPIVLGPIGNNYGNFVDSKYPFAHECIKTEEIRQNFELVWQSLYDKFKNISAN